MIEIKLKTKVDQIYDKADLIFKLLFLSISIFSYNAFTHGTIITTVLIPLTTALAGALLLYKILNWRHFTNNRFFWLIFAFMASYALSALFNYKYGVIGSVKTAAWIGMQYLLLFVTDTRKSFEYYKKQLRTIFGFYLSYIIIANIISLIFLFIRYSSATSSVKPYKEGLLAGFLRGRLWGVYTDPNVGAVMTVIAILISIYFISVVNKKWQKIVLICSMVVNYLYIVFSDSRTAFVAIAIVATLITYLFLLIKKPIQKPALNRIFSIFLALIVSVTCLYSVTLVKFGYKQALDFSLNRPDSSFTEEEKQQIENQFDSRENDISSDISNKRFSLWTASTEVFLDTPIFGTSFANFGAYCQKNLPENYLYVSGFDRFHNMLFDILAAQGILGVITFLTLAAISGITAIKHLILNLKTKNATLYIAMLGILLTALCGAMFTSDLVYINTPIAAIFWYVLGIIVIKSKKEEI